MALFRPMLSAILAVLAVTQAYPAPSTNLEMQAIEQQLVAVGKGVVSLKNTIVDMHARRTPQSTAVTGQLMCKGQPASGVQVNLYDHDSELFYPW